MDDRMKLLKKTMDEHKMLLKKMREEEVKGYGWPEEWLTIQHNLENEICKLAGAGMIIDMYDKLTECRDAILTLGTENEQLRAELGRALGQGKDINCNKTKH